jgi:hypothetical protein
VGRPVSLGEGEDASHLTGLPLGPLYIKAGSGINQLILRIGREPWSSLSISPKELCVINLTGHNPADKLHI